MPPFCNIKNRRLTRGEGKAIAIYHCSVKIIGRNAGRSAVAAAAYRAGEKMTNQYDGITHDYRKKNWVEHKAVLLPDQAPESYQDRETLWNAVEMAEKTKDAQLAREVELALPRELTREQQIHLVEQYVRQEFASQGMCADIAIHNPPVCNDRHQPVDEKGFPTKDREKMRFPNPHAHILLTVRPIGPDGRWEPKAKVEYLCKKDGAEKAFTAEEFRQARRQGWEKQYRFREGKKKVWLTMDEGEEKGLERINRIPRTTPFGRKNPVTGYWNHKDRIFEWREHWSALVNQTFYELSMKERIDSRSLAAQGKDNMLPALHMGAAAVHMERRADRLAAEGGDEKSLYRSDIGEINREIRLYNRMVTRMKKELDETVGQENREKETGKHLMLHEMERIRTELIENLYEQAALSTRYRKARERLEMEQARIARFREERRQTEEMLRKTERDVKTWQKDLRDCGIWKIKQRKELSGKIANGQQVIEDLGERLFNIQRLYDMEGENAMEQAEVQIKETADLIEHLAKMLDALARSAEELCSRFQAISRQWDTQEEKAGKNTFRNVMEEKIKAALREGEPDSFREDVYREVIRRTDQTLGISVEKSERKRKGKTR